MSLTIPFGSIPEHLKSMSYENYIEDGLMGDKDVDSDAPSLPPKDNTLTPLLSVEDGEHVLEDRNKSNDWRLSRDIIGQSETQTENYNYLSEVSIADLEQRISRSWTKHSISKEKKVRPQLKTLLSHQTKTLLLIYICYISLDYPRTHNEESQKVTLHLLTSYIYKDLQER